MHEIAQVVLESAGKLQFGHDDQYEAQSWRLAATFEPLTGIIAVRHDLNQRSVRT